jgi:hypothetical protein
MTANGSGKESSELVEKVRKMNLSYPFLRDNARRALRDHG